MKTRILSILAVVLGVGLMAAAPAAASDTSHTLIVNSVLYSSYKESGDAWHFNTPAGVVPISASVPERSQTWTGNGSDHLPCNYGIHWISNENVLTISHCLEGSTPTTTAPPSTTVPDTSSVSTTTTVEDSTTTTTVPVVTTTTVDIDTPPTTTVPTPAPGLPKTGASGLLLWVGVLLTLAGLALMLVRGGSTD